MARNGMKKNFPLVISLAVLWSGCLSDQRSGQTTTRASKSKAPVPSQNLTVALDWFPEPDYAGIFYAQELGLFEKAGVNVEIVTGKGSILSAAAVAEGKYPLAFCSGGATVLSFNTRTNLVSLAVLYPRVSTVAFGLASAEIKSIYDLRGKRVGIYPGSINNNEWAAFLLANGLKSNEFATVVEVAGPDLPLLKSRRVDALLNYAAMSPTLLELDGTLPEVEGKRIFAFPLADHGVKGYGLNLVTSREALRLERAVLLRVVAAICEGYRGGCAEPEAAVRAFCRRFPDKDPDYVKGGWAKVCAMIQTQARLGQQTEAGWRETIESYRRLGLLKNDLQPAALLPDNP